MNQDIQQIKELFPKLLPPHELIYCEAEKHEILGLSFQTGGVAIRLESGVEIFGSSSDQLNSPLIYAAYECLERFVVATGARASDELQSFRYSISNGVAIHRTLEEAKSNASLELLERNEILKSWYYNTPIQHLNECPKHHFSPDILAQYEVFFVEFCNIPNHSVVGIFAFPRNTDLNLIYGFGSGLFQPDAILKAKKEFVTRLGFLWGESADVGEAEEKRTAHYHQEFYLRHENMRHVRSWIEGKQERKLLGKYLLKDIYFEDLTPSGWPASFSVVKACSKDSIPLFFGLPSTDIFDFPYRYGIPHPVI